MQRLPFIYFGPSELGGRGVFTAKEIERDSLVEVCPVIVLPPEDLVRVHLTCLHDYYFLWGPDLKQGAIVLGFGSLYNHADDPNAECRVDYQSKTLDIYSRRLVAAGEELTISYNEEQEETYPLWFETGSRET